MMWKLLIPVFCFVASTSGQPNYPYPGYPPQSSGYPPQGPGYPPQGGSFGGAGGGGYPGPQIGSMGAGSFGGSSTGQGSGPPSPQFDQVMNQLQSAFGQLEKNGFFNQFASMLGSATSAATGFAKQLTDQLRQVFSEGGAGQKLTQTLGNVMDSTGGVNGFADRLGQTMSAVGGGTGAGGSPPRPPPYRGYRPVPSRGIAYDDGIQV